MKKKLDLEAVFEFIKIINSSEFKYKDELVFYIFLTLKTGMRAAHFNNFRLISKNEIEVSGTNEKTFETSKYNHKIKLSKNEQKDLSCALSKAKGYRSDFPPVNTVDIHSKRYFGESHLPLHQIRKAYISHLYEREQMRRIMTNPDLIFSISSQINLKAFNKESK
ncbi:hypothetical protein [Alteromonas stellipolaris]|uniref:hypothetical protein n=1 Tax=Alteromonas stellipolaris TaxID=233316 RepID=UPI001D24C851|nr:hypothetical protein [Alteromonas stellipolaris]MBZ2161610.1 hypothetical protein [Alteromonas stellipolaris]